jgi:hypothetical protein
MVADALQMDKENGNTLWVDAIALEISAVSILFKQLGEDEKVPVCYQYVDCHLIFDVKLDGFCLKVHSKVGNRILNNSRMNR